MSSGSLPFPPQPLRKAQARSVSVSTPRLGAFASLFGSKAPPTPSSSSRALSPSTEESEKQAHPIDVPAYLIRTRISKANVIRDIIKALTAEMKEALTGLPTWIVDKTWTFTAPLQPVIPTRGTTKKSAKTDVAVLLDLTDATSTAESFQAFYGMLEEELRTKGQRTSTDEKAASTRPAHDDDEWIHQTVERVERVVCAIFYDQYVLQTCNRATRPTRLQLDYSDQLRQMMPLTMKLYRAE